MSNKIVYFPNIKGKLPEVIDDLMKAYHEGRVKNLTLAYTEEYKDGEERKGFVNSIGYYWFGEDSTLFCLGLVSSLESIIRKHLEWPMGDE